MSIGTMSAMPARIGKKSPLRFAVTVGQSTIVPTTMTADKAKASFAASTTPEGMARILSVDVLRDASHGQNRER